MTSEDEDVQECVFFSDGQRAITTSIKDKQLHVRVWDMRPRAPRPLQTLRLASSKGNGIALAPDGKSVAVGERNTLHVWPIKDGRIEAMPPSYGHMGYVNALSFGACGNLLATGGEDGAVRLWDLDGPRPRLRLVLENKTNPWDAVALSPDGALLAAGSRDAGLTLWTVSAAGLRVLAKHKGGANLLAFTPDSQTLFAANGKEPIRIIDLAKPSTVSAELTTGGGFGGFSGEVTVPYHAIAGAPRPAVIPVELVKGDRIEPIEVRLLAVAPDGRSLALCGDSRVEVWGRTSKGWRRRSGFWCFSGYLRSLAFYHKGRKLLAGSDIGLVGQILRFAEVCWDQPVQLSETIERPKPVTSVAASPNGKLLATADEGGHVIVWSDAGRKIKEWTFPGSVRCVAFAPDGQHLALGNGDGTVYILRLAVPKKK